jgi:hypothetical protein
MSLFYQLTLEIENSMQHKVYIKLGFYVCGIYMLFSEKIIVCCLPFGVLFSTSQE